jgi:hypothetical protein
MRGGDGLRRLLRASSEAQGRAEIGQRSSLGHPGVRWATRVLERLRSGIVGGEDLRALGVESNSSRIVLSPFRGAVREETPEETPTLTKFANLPKYTCGRDRSRCCCQKPRIARGLKMKAFCTTGAAADRSGHGEPIYTTAGIVIKGRGWGVPDCGPERSRGANPTSEDMKIKIKDRR